MSNKVVIGNFKMNFTITETRKHLNAFVPLVEHSGIDVGLCLPYTSLAIAKRSLKDSNVLLGAQNVSEHDRGAFTGEISAEMLKDAGCKLVLVGHSERRKNCGEKDSVINLKIKQNLRHGLTSVLCIGENKRERINDLTRDVICKQLDDCLSGLYENELENIIIAYEPIWAIGTGEVATAKQVEEAVKIIRQEVARLYSENISKKIVVLYGGSVKPTNAKNFYEIKTLNGFLVGGVSLDPNAFAELIKNYKTKK